MAFGTTPTSTTSLSQNQFPVSAVAEPGRANGDLTALEGGPGTVDSNSNRTAPVSMYVKDGGDIAQGTSTDANTVNSVMGRLTKIRDLLSATLTVGGTITEANSASIKSDLDAINTAIGTIADAAWSGSGSGSEIAILKKIVAELAATLTVSGTVTANAGTGTFTNQQSNVTTDYDTGAGTQNLTMFGVALPASGGAIAGGTSTNPIRTDPTGTTTQPVSGTVTANAGTNLNTSLLALEAGGNLASIKTDADSIVTNTSTTATNTSTTATVLGATGDVAVVGDTTGTLSAKLRGLTKILNDVWDSVNHLFHFNLKQLAGTATDTNSGNKSAGTLRVVLATDQPQLTNALKMDGSAVTQPVSGTVTANGGTPSTTATATLTNVTAAATDTSLLTSNGSRKGALFFNDSTAILYLSYGSGAASTTSYSVQVAPNGFFELPPSPVFTGAMRGIWSAVNGAARITELS